MAKPKKSGASAPAASTQVDAAAALMALANLPGVPQGTIAWVATAHKGVVCAFAQPMADGFAVPIFDALGVADRTLSPVKTGEGAHPWSGKEASARSYAAMGCYVAKRMGVSNVQPLHVALEKGDVVAVTLYRPDGSAVVCYLPKGWTQADVVPQYVGTLANGSLGRFEPDAHPDKTRRHNACYVRLHVRLSVNPPKAKADAEPSAKV